MQVLSYGFKNPDNGDKGSVWFPALNFDIVQLNGHTHDGVTSPLINGSAIAAGVVSAPSGSWVLDVLGRYRQDVTVPVGFVVDGFMIQARISSTSAPVFPTIEKLTTTTFRIYTIDNTLSYTVNFK